MVAGGGSAILLAWAPEHLWFIPLGVILAMLTLVVRVGSSTASAAAQSPGIGLTLLGALYVGALFPYFALLRNRPGGIAVIILILLLVIASDTGAYFVGSWMGRTRLAPRVSPKKTVEGAIGGLALCVLAGLLLRQPLVPGWSVGQTVALSAAIGVLAQLGDLAGSALKRSAGVKDSGWIFPGHGGLLDRTCSMVFATVFDLLLESMNMARQPNLLVEQSKIMITSILSAVIIFAVLIIVHETGHFLMAKRSGVRVIRYSVGYPPKLFGIRRGETEYAFGATPLGGYVRMLGDEVAEEPTAETLEGYVQRAAARPARGGAPSRHRRVTGHRAGADAARPRASARGRR